MIKTAILTISDTRNKSNDESGKAIKEILGDGFELCAYDIVKDDKQAIKDILIHYADSLNVDVILTTGGTGLMIGLINQHIKMF